ncbi:hypothetical protein SBRCBS47491_008546 [Sporothrix bragantina]|uniref:Uncharacterized protein n=1 Tax=Sporothrix bragantina TaxID=671064 RepID=A0ABP0CQG0_9PEZI
MPPVSISSGDDEDDKKKAAAGATTANEEDSAARVARLRTWVYNAMLTLAGLGEEGAKILAADELYIAGPGNVRLRTDGQMAKRLKRDETNDSRLLNEMSQDNGGDLSAQNTQEEPDLNDPTYWQNKLRYLESKCMPLSQERRKRRRLAPESQIAAEDAARIEAELRAAEGGGFAPVVPQNTHDAAAVLSPEEVRRQHEEKQARDESRAERERIEQSKLLWREKRARIDRWVQALAPPQLTRCSDGGYSWLFAGVPSHAAPFAGNIGGPPLPRIVDVADMSDVSIVEITPAQFSNVRQQQPQQQQQPLRHQHQERKEEVEEEEEECDEDSYDEEYEKYLDQCEEGEDYEGEDDGDDEDGHTADSEESQVMDLLHMVLEKMTEAATERVAQTLEAATAKQSQAEEDDKFIADALREAEEWDRQKSEQRKLLEQEGQQQGALKVPAAAGDATLDVTAMTATTATAPQTAATAPTPAVETPITSASPGEATHADDATKTQSPPAQIPREGNIKSRNSTPVVLGKRRRSDTNVEDTAGRA